MSSDLAVGTSMVLQLAARYAFAQFMPWLGVGQALVDAWATHGTGGPEAMQNLAHCLGTARAAKIGAIVSLAYPGDAGGRVLGEVARVIACRKPTRAAADRWVLPMHTVLVGATRTPTTSSARIATHSILEAATGQRIYRRITDDDVARVQRAILEAA